MKLFHILPLFLYLSLASGGILNRLSMLVLSRPESPRQNAHKQPRLQEVTTTQLSYQVTIDTHYAVTEVTTTFVNNAEEATNAVFQTIIPNGAYITGFEMTVDGQTFIGVVMPKEEAEQVYDDAVDRGDDAGLVSDTGSNTFAIAVSLSGNSEAVFLLTHDLLIARRLDWYEYDLEILQAGGEFSDAVVSISVNEPDGITRIETNSPTDPAPSVDLGATMATIQYPPDGESVPTKTHIVLSLRYKTQQPAHDVGSFLTDSERQFFVHLFTPPPLLPEFRKAVVFVLDQSGSMNGRKFEQLQEAVQIIIDRFNSQDYFNIVFFDDVLYHWKDTLIQATNANKNDAKTYVAEKEIAGSTNINIALLEGISNLHETELPGGSNFARQIIFLTDGQPTAGITNPALIRLNVRNDNVDGYSIYCLGLGDNLDYELIRGIALENNGFERRILEHEDVVEQLTTFFEEIDSAVMSDIELLYTANTGVVDEVTEKNAPLIFQGSELLVAGKIPAEAETLSIEVGGKGSDFNNLQYLHDFVIGVAALRETDIPISKLWAFRQLDVLRDHIDMYTGVDGRTSQVAELKEAALNLSLEYGFVNEFTSLVVVASEDFCEEPNCEGGAEGDVDPPPIEDQINNPMDGANFNGVMDQDDADDAGGPAVGGNPNTNSNVNGGNSGEAADRGDVNDQDYDAGGDVGGNEDDDDVAYGSDDDAGDVDGGGDGGDPNVEVADESVNANGAARGLIHISLCIMLFTAILLS